MPRILSLSQCPDIARNFPAGVTAPEGSRVRPVSRSINSLLLFFVLIFAVRAAEPVKTVLVVSDDWCPFSCEADSAERGILVDIVEEILAANGLLVEYQTLPWYRARHLVETGEASVALGLAEVTTSKLLRNDEPLYRDETVLIWRRGEGQRYTGPQVLENYRVGVSASNNFDSRGDLDRYLDDRRSRGTGITALFEEASTSSLILMLMSGRIDVFLADIQAISRVLEATGQLDQVDIVETGKGNNLYAGVTPSDEGREYARIIDEGISSLKASGRMIELLDKYDLNNRPDTIALPPDNTSP